MYAMSHGVFGVLLRVFGLLGLVVALGVAVRPAALHHLTNPIPPRRPPFTPTVLNTWPFTEATQAAWNVIGQGGRAVDAVHAACRSCEVAQCDGTVGYGGSPDEEGSTSLDAMIMDGDTMEVGAVANVRRVKEAVTAAKLVMRHSKHTMLAGDEASEFAHAMGLAMVPNLSTPDSLKMYQSWVANDCQPNFRRAVRPDPLHSCGPYRPYTTYSPYSPIDPLLDGPLKTVTRNRAQQQAVVVQDTISAIALDVKGSMAVACSTNGAIHKVPGRVGDGAVPGGGAYVDGEVGGCGSTGDGDVHLRFLPCFVTVENMRRGMSPQRAAEDAVKRIIKHVPNYVGAVVAMDVKGRHGAASHGWETFQYAYKSQGDSKVRVVNVVPLSH
jgi:N4-(beta-N-acetylglucosaminyl)-L-asparaginase